MNSNILIVDLNSLLPLAKKVQMAIAQAHADRSIIVGIANLGMTFYANQTELRLTLESIPQIQGFYVCLDPQGQQCLYMSQSNPDIFYRLDRQRIARELNLIGKFRNPDPGLLVMAIRHSLRDTAARALYVGDRNEDEQAAKAIGIEFEWTECWRGDLADKASIS